VICEVTPMGLPIRGVGRFISHAWEVYLSRLGGFFSHRAHRVHGAFRRTFRAHRTPPAYRVHRALLLKVAVRFCEIGWLNVSVECCVFCSSVFICEKKNNCETRWEGFSLTEHTEFTEHLGARFELTERLRHTEFTERYC